MALVFLINGLVIMYFVNFVYDVLLQVFISNLLLKIFFNMIFFLATAERHIPKCKNIFNRPKPPLSNRSNKENKFPVFGGLKNQG